MSPLGAAVLGGLLGLLIGFVVSALLHGPSRPPNKGAGAVAGTDIRFRPCPQRVVHGSTKLSSGCIVAWRP